ncbi:hypothetical protein CAAN1_05S03268 [[Candida] anglica]|uniref:Zn(2)-C6 fungal-type domain-containing protein n=1 Tax=[Candida] anglica TaxID=148631 RepID=A0ABP0ECW2_9ASCO
MPKGKRSRTRSGCLTCRDRHMKCDEQQPVCKNCLRSNRKCYRGIRLNFAQYTMYDPDSLEEATGRKKSEIGLDKQLSNKSYHIIDSSITIASLFKNGRAPYTPYIGLHTTEELQEAELHYQHDMKIAAQPDQAVVLDRRTSSSSATDDALHLKSDDPIYKRRAGSSSLGGLNQDIISAKRSSSRKSGRSSIGSDIGLDTNSGNITNPIITSSIVATGIHSTTTSSSNITSSTSTTITTTTIEPIHPYNDDLKTFIHLLQDQKYYWLLDMFNELSIWKSFIPSYCNRLGERDPTAGGDGNRPIKSGSIDQLTSTLLIKCLLCCSHQGAIKGVKSPSSPSSPPTSKSYSSDYPNHIIDEQYQFWVMVQDDDSLKGLLHTAISIVLVMVGVLVRICRMDLDHNETDDHGADTRPIEGATFDKHTQKNKQGNKIIALQKIFYQQIELFNKLIIKLNPTLTLSGKNTFEHVLFISVLHSVVILKFILHQLLETQQFSKLNTFEIDLLLSPKKYEYTQLSIQKDEPKSEEEFSDTGLERPRRRGRTGSTGVNVSVSASVSSIGTSASGSSSVSGQVSNAPSVGSSETASTENSNYGGKVSELNPTTIGPSYKSESFKLRNHFWSLIKMDHINRFKDNTFPVQDHSFIYSSTMQIRLPNESTHPQKDTLLSVLPNDRAIVINLTREYMKKIVNKDDKNVINLANAKINGIFHTIKLSLTDDEVKRQWKSIFSWVKR